MDLLCISDLDSPQLFTSASKRGPFDDQTHRATDLVDPVRCFIIASTEQHPWSNCEITRSHYSIKDSPTTQIAHVNQTDFKFVKGLERIEEDM